MDTGKKTRKRRSAQKKTLTKEQDSRLEAIESYLSLPERLRPRFPPLGPMFSGYDYKKPPGIQPSDPIKLKISYFVRVNPVFAKHIDDVLKKNRGNLSVKDPKIKKLRQEIIDTVPSLDKRDETKVREWLRDRHDRLKRKNKR
jgi:hypothetical protein